MIIALFAMPARLNPWLVALAVLICCVGASSIMRLFRQAVAAQGVTRHAWVFLAAIIAAGAIWCTHFVALLAMLPEVRAAYDPLMTMASLLIALAGTNLGLWIAANDKNRVCAALGGMVVGIAIAAMHLVDVQALRAGNPMRLPAQVIENTIALSVGLAMLAFSAERGNFGSRMARFSPLFLVCAILAFDFSGMAAGHMPLRASGAQVSLGRTQALGAASAVLALLVFAAGGLASLINQRTRNEAQAHIQSLLMVDSLTGLANRDGFDLNLAALLQAAGPDTAFMLATLKFAHFDDIIERHGKEIANAVIKTVGARLLAAKPSEGAVARVGRAEFVAIGRFVEPENARLRIRRNAEALAGSVVVGTEMIAVEPRIGVAFYPADAKSANDLLRCSRQALERALQDPLEPVSFFDERLDAVVGRRHMIASDLRGALARQEFELFYQPQVWIEDRRIIGQEALLRWRHPVLGMISPAEFIPLAERTGEILPIGRWVLQTACAQAMLWPADWHVAVNVSPLQLRQDDLPEQVEAAIASSGLAPNRLEIELTESLLVEDRARALDVSQRIRALGVRLSLDDFGTGYSSLDVLRHFPFDKIKLDKSFVNDIEANPQSRAILQAILAMGRSLGIPILVEGVETEHQLAILRAEGCNKVQGFLTGRPVPVDRITPDATRGRVIRLKAG